MRFKCGFRNFVSPVWVLSNTYALQQVAHRSLLPSVLFDWQVPEGRCVGLKFPNLPSDHPYSLGNVIHDEHHWIRRALHPQEIEYGLTQTTPARQHSFWMGRLAMHQLLIGEQICILKDSYGRPIMPHGWYGSISHKENTAVALISQTRRVGVDLETTRRKRTNIARRILTPNEANDLGNIQGLTADEEVLLRFSLKEAAYKAIHPIVCQYVGFQEAEVKPLEDGTALITLDLKSRAHDRIGEITAHWRRIDGDLFLSTASAEPADEFCER